MTGGGVTGFATAQPVSIEAVPGVPGAAEVLLAGALIVGAIALLGGVTAVALGRSGRRSVLVVAAALGVGTVVAAGVAAAAAPAVGTAPVSPWRLAAQEPASPDRAEQDDADRRRAAESAAPTAPESLEDAPSLDEGRRQFQELATLAVEAAGPGARWREPGGIVVVEEPCAFGVLLRIDALYRMGEITDTSSDEHDREVVDDNVAAAERIGRAWRAGGLGDIEMLRGEPHFGAGAFTAVDAATIGYDFGVAQPRVVSRCLPAG